MAIVGCSSLGGFDYGDGEADRFTAGDDEPYVPDDQDDDAPSAPVTGPSGTGVDPSTSDDGAATDLRPDDSASGSSDDTGGSDESGSTTGSSDSGEAGDNEDPGGSDTSGTSGPDEPANLPKPEPETTSTESSTDDGTPA